MPKLDYTEFLALAQKAKLDAWTGKELYKNYFASLNQMHTPKFKIHTKDVG